MNRWQSEDTIWKTKCANTNLIPKILHLPYIRKSLVYWQLGMRSIRISEQMQRKVIIV